MMKKLNSALVLILFSVGLLAQDVAGIWVGELPQYDDSIPYLLEKEIVQNGDSLSGTSRIVNPENINWALMEFTGVIKEDEIVIVEHNVLENWIAPSCLTRKSWLLKELRGSLTIDKETEEEIFSGRWFSERRWVNVNGYILPTTIRRPGRFVLERYDPTEADIKEGQK